MSAETGVPVAVFDGTEITLRRTAAASALASSFLSRSDATKLLMVGTGNMAPHLIAAHCSLRPISDVCIWGRRGEAAEKLAATLATASFNVTVTGNLGQAVSAADIISCATLASEPLIKGEWLVDGQHLDLVGAFKPDMREADSNAVSRAAVYVDTLSGAVSEAGDIVQAIADGEVAPGMQGLDPTVNGQLTKEEIKRCELDPSARLEMSKPTVPLPKSRQKGTRYTPISKRQDRPDAIAWLLRSHPELSDAQISLLIGTTKPTITAVREKTHRNISSITPQSPIYLGLCSASELEKMVMIARTRIGNHDTVPGESITNSPSQTSENVPVSPWDDMPVANSSVEEKDIPSVSEVFGTKPTN